MPNHLLEVAKAESAHTTAAEVFTTAAVAPRTNGSTRGPTVASAGTAGVGPQRWGLEPQRCYGRSEILIAAPEAFVSPRPGVSGACALT